MPSSKGTWLVREKALEHKWHSRLSWIVEACCASNDANQCPGRYMGGKKGGKAKLSFPTRYLLLNSLNSGRGTEGTRMFCFLSSDFASKKLPRTSIFCHEASVNQPICQVKPTLLSLFVLDWTCGGFCYLGAFPFDSSKCGVCGQYIPFSPVCEPSHCVQWMGVLTNHLW